MFKKKEWHYTASGKMWRGFVWLVSLAVFVAGCVYLYQMYSEYGMSMFDANKVPYQQTDSYKEDLERALNSVQDSVLKITSSANKVAMYDTVTNNYYARIADESGEETEGSGGVYEVLIDGAYTYEISVNQVVQRDMPFDNYEWAASELKKTNTGDAYIRFNKESFCNLFKKCGDLNINNKYSEEFSESCYFVFPNVMEHDIFAVYNPQDDTYYSTMDNYFPAYNSYVYAVSDVLNSVENDSLNYNNIIFPLLKSYNYELSYVIDKFEAINYGIDEAYKTLKGQNEDAFLYYYKGEPALSEWGKNVDEYKDITELPEFYYLSLSDRTIDYGQASLSEALEKEDKSIKEAQCSWWDSKTELFFGMDYARAEKNLKASGSSRTKNMYYYLRYKNYNNGARFFFLVLVLVAIMFVVFLYSTVRLVLVTGRKGEVDENGKFSKVYLNFFDKSPTEIYLLFLFGVSIFVGYIDYVIILEFYTRFRKYLVFSVVGIGVSVFVYGFLFMVLALSLVRRLKAHNLLNHIGFVHFIKWCSAKVIEFYHKHKGKKLLSILFQAYMGIQLIILLIMLAWAFRQDSIFPFIVVVFLCVIPNLLAIGAVKSLFNDVTMITQCMDKIKQGDLDAKCGMDDGGHFLSEVAEGVDGMGEGIKLAVEKSVQDERMRTELITNVSHDLKTPLTSIINYVDLLKKEDMYSDAAKHYVEVLEQKSQRLKHLTEDLVEAAKANTGNIELECMPLAFDELMRQAIGEFEDKFVTRGLNVISSFPDQAVIIMADGRRLFRIVENVLQNAYKYAMENTRIYADLTQEDDNVVFALKNISKAPLNISPEELMERFTRGDSSRSTEGSGLGLSIAKDLTALMDGKFAIKLDGDLFKVVIEFPIYVEPEKPQPAELNESEESEQTEQMDTISETSEEPEEAQEESKPEA